MEKNDSSEQYDDKTKPDMPEGELPSSNESGAIIIVIWEEAIATQKNHYFIR